MTRIDDIGDRLARVETKVDNIEADVTEMRGDIRDIKSFQVAEGAGLTRPERIAIAAAGSAVIGAVIGMIALLTSSGP